MWPRKDLAYDSLPQSENIGVPASSKSSRPYLLSPRFARSTIVLIATNAIALLALAVSVISHGSNETHSERSWRDVSTASPALDAVNYLPPKHYNAEFRQTNKWRAGPGVHSEEVDIAWHYIELGAGGIRLTEAEVRDLNITGSEESPLHKVPEEHGGGYLAMLEVFHLLHCLNSLRMGLWFNYDKYYKSLDDGVPDENVYTHFDHCIDMLRMSLMCSADVTPAVFVDPLQNPLRRDALPNWSSKHTCRDFDAILAWNTEGPRAVRWRDAGSNPSWDPNLKGADPPFPPEGHGGDHHHGH